jgi:hypothetical protein
MKSNESSLSTRESFIAYRFVNSCKPRTCVDSLLPSLEQLPARLLGHLRFKNSSTFRIDVLEFIQILPNSHR